MVPRSFLLRFLVSFSIITVNLSVIIAQTKILQQIPEFPSTEVYDLLTDSKGFLWIAHNGGISKYDGINFISYSYPLQTSLGASGLFEDKYGRIWFNNFTGQIFYIQNGRMNLLNAYDSRSEPNFPRIGLFNDMLVATTKKGLFICDINTLKCHYATCPGLTGNGTTSLAVFKDKVVAYGNRKWFIYKPVTGLRPAYFNAAGAKLIDENVGTLVGRTFRDTAFLFCNPARVVYKITAGNDSLKLCDMPHFQYYINTVTVLKDKYFINTSQSSIEKPNNDTIKGANLNCVSVDKQGHYWYGSLLKGLLAPAGPENKSTRACSLPLPNGDVITCLAKNGGNLLIGTQFGKLISYDPLHGRPTILTTLLPKHNGIRGLMMVDSSKVLICSPANTFVLNIASRQIERTYRYLAIKQAGIFNHSLLFATSSGLIVMPDKNNRVNFESWKTGFDKQFKGFNEREEVDGPYKLLVYEQRAMAACYSSKTETIWAALKNGLYKINRAGPALYYFNNLPVYASCLANYNSSVIVGTINNGVLIIGDDDSVRRLSTDDGLLSNTILHLKIINNNLWIYDNGLVQVFDINNLKVVTKYQLPDINPGLITDVEEINGQPYLANANGLYKVPFIKKDDYNVGVYPNLITINGKDTGSINDIKLPYYKNDLQISLGAPSLTNGKNIFIKYRLSTTDRAKWIYGKPGERNFRFGSLSPGSYHFEAYAGTLPMGVYGHPLKLNFTISPPRWKTWWAFTLMGIAGASIVFSVARLYYLNLLSNEKTEFEKKLAIEKERQRISSDMHDDIGANLSALRLYTKSIQNPGDVLKNSQVDEMMNELSDKVREIIWRLDKNGDTLAGLINFIEATSVNLFKHSPIKFNINLPDLIPEIDIDTDTRHDIFLIVKEGLNNAIKHSMATEVLLKISFQGNRLKVIVKDDGTGIWKPANEKKSGRGLTNIKKRAENLKASISIESNEGTTIMVDIPLSESRVSWSG
jgi:signal transduction histidine kinase